jgi:hypothetical protein
MNDETQSQSTELVPDLSQAQLMVRFFILTCIASDGNDREEVALEISLHEASPPPMGQAP